MWLTLRLAFASFLFVSGIWMIAASAIEWKAPMRECGVQIRTWVFVQAVCQLVAVPLSLLSRYLVNSQQRARTTSTVLLALTSRLMNLFLFSWFIVGWVWLVASFNGSYHCRSSFPLSWHTMLVFLAVEMVALFVAVVGLVFSCITLAARMLLLANGGALREAERQRGASVEEITEHSELRPYAPEMFPDAEDAKCVVCLGEYEAGDELRYLRCQHHFHKECVDEWLRRQGSCPLCVRQLGESSDSTNSQRQDDDDALLDDE